MSSCDMIHRTIEGREFARNINCRFFETSALNDVNVSNAFHELVRLIRGTGNQQVHETYSRAFASHASHFCIIIGYEDGSRSRG